jgi:hypothetical protein
LPSSWALRSCRYSPARRSGWTSADLLDRVVFQPEYLGVVARQVRSSFRHCRLLHRHTSGHVQPIRSPAGGSSKMHRPSSRSLSNTFASAKRHCETSISIIDRLNASAPRTDRRTGIQRSGDSPRAAFACSRIWFSRSTPVGEANVWSDPLTKEGPVNVARSKSTVAYRSRIVTPSRQTVSWHVTSAAAASITKGLLNNALRRLRFPTASGPSSAIFSKTASSNMALR